MSQSSDGLGLRVWICGSGMEYSLSSLQSILCLLLFSDPLLS
jgi:hypothetical protein